ncbi:MAG: hypothetical protein K1X79_07040 [Oligoflexia bacterium]|nr:hypothetical protein [Oligoflexia bacterium]
MSFDCPEHTIAQTFPLSTRPARLSRRGRPALYRSDELANLVFQCWLGRERMCAKRLVFQLESWIIEYEAANGAVRAELRERFLNMSAATIDRVLSPMRIRWKALQTGRDQQVSE